VGGLLVLMRRAWSRVRVVPVLNLEMLHHLLPTTSVEERVVVVVL
jgi:hypothetical protein